MRIKAKFTREINLLELLNKEIPSCRKLREALSKLSKAQESVKNDFTDIYNKCREKNQDRCVRSTRNRV